MSETVSLFFQAGPPTASSDLYFHQAAAYCFALQCEESFDEF